MNSSDANADVATVRIPLEKYQQLLKASYRLKLLKEWASLTDEAFPRVIECAHPGCEAVQVTDDRQYSHTLEKHCKSMSRCYYSYVCNEETFYCNIHIGLYLTDHEEHGKTGETFQICNLCKEYLDDMKELEKLECFQPRDIQLVIEQTNVSKLEAAQALLKRNGDIVMAIMDIQS